MTFQVTAAYSTRNGAPQSVEASLVVATPPEAREIAAQFPKSIKLYATTLSSGGDDLRGYLKFSAVLLPNGVNDGVNETGLKRFRSFLKKAEALGYAIEYRKSYSNSYESMADFNDALIEASGEAFA